MAKKRTAPNFSYPEDNLASAEAIQAGLPATSLQETAAEFGVGTLALADTLQLARRTVTRRLAQKKKLTSAESEKVLRVQKLLRTASKQFRDEAAARRWFQHPLHVLGGKTPLELCATEPGGKEVEAVLGRIAHGIFG